MEELVILKNKQALCDSLQVAEVFERQHRTVLAAIENVIKNSSAEKSAQCFHQSTYKDSTGKSNKMYYMNRDGFSIVAMGFTGKKALEWKWKYIEAFNKMESTIRELSSQEHIESRKLGKLTRKAETDLIKELVEYAREQGSEHPEKLYMTYSKLANKTVGAKDRNLATVSQLNNLALVESIILQTIKFEMAQKIYYKEIYKDCKARLESFASIAYLTAG
ncbi:MAG: Rha family transcriptional regulator [Lachnospiraceae bacterium]